MEPQAEDTHVTQEAQGHILAQESQAQPSESKHMAASVPSPSSRMDEESEPSMGDNINESLDSTLVADMSLEEEEITKVDMSQEAEDIQIIT